ncbi:MAG TPA: hypothetical protein VE935_19275, partial [Burkholderiales bacterium]|nr:hypothetical protein [Burkholderiales bacterium]
MDGLQAVSHVRQGAPDDHAHRVIEVGTPHLLLERYRERFFGEGFHAGESEMLSRKRRFSLEKRVVRRKLVRLKSGPSGRRKIEGGKMNARTLVLATSLAFAIVGC